MDFHLQKLNRFCRFCKNVIADSRQRKKEAVLETLKLQYPEVNISLEDEDPDQFPLLICGPCFSKCSNWKSNYNKHKIKIGQEICY